MIADMAGQEGIGWDKVNEPLPAKPKMTIQEALASVLEDLKKKTPAQLRAELESSRESEFAKTMVAMGEVVHHVFAQAEAAGDVRSFECAVAHILIKGTVTRFQGEASILYLVDMTLPQGQTYTFHLRRFVHGAVEGNTVRKLLPSILQGQYRDEPFLAGFGSKIEHYMFDEALCFERMITSIVHRHLRVAQTGESA